MAGVATDVRRLARDVLAPLAHAGEPGRVNCDLVDALGELRLLAPVLPVDGKLSALELCCIREAPASELAETETAQLVADTAIQVRGAEVLEEGHLREHLYRDVYALRIYEGAEIWREIIGREAYR